VTSALSIRLTRTWTSLPVFVVYGRPMTSYSPVLIDQAVAKPELHRQDAQLRRFSHVGIGSFVPLEMNRPRLAEDGFGRLARQL
jgi:hypothetical protein